MHDHYVVVTDSSFLGDLLNDGDIWSCPEVTAKWVVDHGYGFYSDSAGDAATPPWDGAAGETPVPAPTIESASVSDAAPTLVVINFNSCVEVTSITGITVEVDTVAVSQVSVAASNDELTVTLTAAVVNGEAVTFTYSEAGGDVIACGAGNAPVADVTEFPVTNLVLP